MTRDVRQQWSKANTVSDTSSSTTTTTNTNTNTNVTAAEDTPLLSGSSSPTLHSASASSRTAFLNHPPSDSAASAAAVAAVGDDDEPRTKLGLVRATLVCFNMWLIIFLLGKYRNQHFNNNFHIHIYIHVREVSTMYIYGWIKI